MTDLPNSYMNLDQAKRAIKRAGLSQMDVRYDDVTGSYRGAKNILPVVLVDLIEDKREVENRGFRAEMKFTRFAEGATVKLKPEVAGAKKGELAKIKVVNTEIKGGVVLDRRLGGTMYWNVSDLILIEREDEA